MKRESTLDCASRMQELYASNAEGEERLAEKNNAIASARRNKGATRRSRRWSTRRAKYEEQPVVKRQAVAECQLAALGYANALRGLKAEYGK